MISLKRVDTLIFLNTHSVHVNANVPLKRIDCTPIINLYHKNLHVSILLYAFINCEVYFYAAKKGVSWSSIK